MQSIAASVIVAVAVLKYRRFLKGFYFKILPKFLLILVRRGIIGNYSLKLTVVHEGDSQETCDGALLFYLQTRYLAVHAFIKYHLEFCLPLKENEGYIFIIALYGFTVIYAALQILIVLV